MGRPAGSQNLLTREKAETLAALVRKYKLSPLESHFKQREHWFAVLDAEMVKSSRHRHAAKVKEAREWIFRLNEAMAPYVHPKHQSITSQAEVKQIQMAIRAPEPISDSQEWLRQCKPANLDSDRPVPLAPALRQYVEKMDQEQAALDDADAVIADINRRMGGH
jgi:hypothetical protein